MKRILFTFSFQNNIRIQAVSDNFIKVKKDIEKRGYYNLYLINACIIESDTSQLADPNDSIIIISEQ